MLRPGGDASICDTLFSLHLGTVGSLLLDIEAVTLSYVLVELDLEYTMLLLRGFFPPRDSLHVEVRMSMLLSVPLPHGFETTAIYPQSTLIRTSP